MGQKPGNEERKFKRTDVSFIVSYQVNAPSSVRVSIGNKEFDAEALDLSLGGIGILSKHTHLYAIPAFTIVSIKFTLVNDSASKIEDRYQSMEIKGEVRSSLFMKALQAYRLGISFIDVSSQQHDFLVRLISMS